MSQKSCRSHACFIRVEKSADKRTKEISVSSFPKFKDSTSLLCEISWLHAAGDWESTEEKYVCVLELSPYTSLVSVSGDSILDRFLLGFRILLLKLTEARVEPFSCPDPSQVS